MLTSYSFIVFGPRLQIPDPAIACFSRPFAVFRCARDGSRDRNPLSVHALELALPSPPIATPYYARPEGSFSKLNTWLDGLSDLGHHPDALRRKSRCVFFTAIGMCPDAGSIGLAIPHHVT